MSCREMVLNGVLFAVAATGCESPRSPEVSDAGVPGSSADAGVVADGAPAAPDAGVEVDAGDEPQTYSGPVRFSLIEHPACQDGSPDRWSYDVTLEGMAFAVELDVVEAAAPTEPWLESHPMDNYDWDEDELSWDKWQLDLQSLSSGQTIDQLDYTRGETTAFPCAFADSQLLAWKVTAYDAEEQQLDCAIWGHEAVATFQGDGCICFDCEQ